MKQFHPTSRLLAVAGLAVLALPLLSAQTPNRRSAPIVITPPAVHDGSNSSRAPFIAARPFDDAKRPNGEAIDLTVPPNTPSTNPDPVAPPPPAVAMFRPRGEPGLMPTGRPTTGAAAALDAPHELPVIRSDTAMTRDQLLDDLEVRIRNAQTAMNAYHQTLSEMSATGQEQFKTSAADVHAREKALMKSIRRAHDAKGDNWDAAREQVAVDYEAYANSLAQIDAAAGVQPVR
jgi:hypothetical protein